MNEDSGSFQTLVDIVDRLRSPGGCPWDREQTHSSLKRNLLEECYEVLEAIDGGEGTKLSEELGDILVQVVFHSQMAREAGTFSIDDVVTQISHKLVRRHPHVFGDAVAKDAGEVERNWDRLKQQEAPAKSPADEIPKELPALAYAQLMQDRVGRVGFEWEDVSGVLDKVAEEVNELNSAPSDEERAQELGRPSVHHSEPGALAEHPRRGRTATGELTISASLRHHGTPGRRAVPRLPGAAPGEERRSLAEGEGAYPQSEEPPSRKLQAVTSRRQWACGNCTELRSENRGSQDGR